VTGATGGMMRGGVASGGAALGIDVGGTKTLGCVVDVSTGHLIDRIRVDTNARRGGPWVLAQAADVARELRDRHALGDAPVGVSLCEVVDAHGRPASAVTVDWLGLDVAAAFAGTSRVVVESDVRAAAIGEGEVGAGVGVAQFVYVTVGTGIAHTLVVDGVAHRGHRGAAVLLGAPPVERVASGPAIAARAGTVDAQAAFDDPAYGPVISEAAVVLGHALATLAAALDPEVVIVGGGLGMRDDYRTLAAGAMSAALADAGAAAIEVRPAALGEASAAVGAAIVATRSV
jgi:glucokinase